MQWYLSVLKQYAEFSGRARRKQYWMFNLVNLIILLALFVLNGMAHTEVFTSIYSLGIFLPALAVTVRRLHDTGRSGWWCLVSFIPIIGSLILLYFVVQDSVAGSNEFGPNPKEVVTV
ncbi:DUF805 domain-containing protein [Vibrio palustris]|uniref:Inner membrane protein YhaI n=1 Tax=Vibrio palustris TaxID=1918946 RepID=A0A1R4B387_9VIBR|nr:DUF805 domain-containing protein [Vibrio palustris]SJL83377.1 Inner membrane protein YhaI [Vibrio palustris]